jgi:hypothetical protein
MKRIKTIEKRALRLIGRGLSLLTRIGGNGIKNRNGWIGVPLIMSGVAGKHSFWRWLWETIGSLLVVLTVTEIFRRLFPVLTHAIQIAIVDSCGWLWQPITVHRLTFISTWFLIGILALAGSLFASERKQSCHRRKHQNKSRPS